MSVTEATEATEAPAATAVAVGTVVRRIAHDLVADFTATEAAALEDLPDGVHRHRTQVRRLRGALAALRDLLDPDQIVPLEVALREWGTQLGEVRDAEVRAATAAAAIEEAAIDDPAVHARLVEAETEVYRRLHARLVALHDEPRGRRRTRELEAFAADPAVRDPDADALTVFAGLLRHEARRVRRAGRRLDGSMERYHDLRKAGRRLRYLAEAVSNAEPELFGDAGVALAKAGKQIHDVLGAHRDELLFARRLDRVRVRAKRAGESPEPYEKLAGAAHARASARIAELDRVLRRVRRAARRVRAHAAEAVGTAGSGEVAVVRG